MRHSKRELLLSRRKHLGSRQDGRSRGKPQQTLLELATSAHPFDRWLREQFQLLLGWNLQEVLPGQHHELIFTWSGKE